MIIRELIKGLSKTRIVDPLHLPSLGRNLSSSLSNPSDPVSNAWVLLELVVVHTNVPCLMLPIVQLSQSVMKSQRLEYDLAHGDVTGDLYLLLLFSFCL